MVFWTQISHPQASFRTASAESLLKLLTMTAPCFNRTGQLGFVRHTRDVTSRPLAPKPSLKDAINADARSSQPHSVRLVSYVASQGRVCPVYPQSCL